MEEYETVPKEPYGDFLAMVQGEHDYLIEAFSIDCGPKYGRVLTLGTKEGAVYITHDQAKAFFGFTD